MVWTSANGPKCPVSPEDRDEIVDKPPFREGDIVRIKGEDHLGLHRIDECEWFDRTSLGVPAYWLCECTQIREPVDWSKYKPGTTGIVTGSSWRGSAEHLALTRPERHSPKPRADMRQIFSDGDNTHRYPDGK